ncbi:electron transfer flavoprotein subunit beta [Thermosipho melanesiensis]|uniref:Electron transfer flavoprotein, alpha/beta-subunit-like protein n=2 Tax=Thermosipho melanesiensis TaxID=46541 RepID=A6LKR8_THEM4|nr:electron transfer flavoprotein subunit beta/FixA family protein [Thermosipho melanesiensis]ABR30519.1 Electron transfer flavoprotein, alpha/beta-subunit-like protein [Thermosipho melanesiensis BI429]APT73670.1 electron transfer flavoprotein subunit beta [Thermosipho melanesiensis]OOC35610.1 electron transfer flavoprotein subunit beta [Thermosipho melanesiensis]OOC39284.1 electron transfer flavoprotein subunit beta [Thermosipho melanesiensis]OOC39370.1 electron transfer flavoprotein subunit 
MKVIVFAKQVPDTSEVKIDKEKGTLIRDNVSSIMNPEDKNALEVALRLKEQLGAKVIVITMGPPSAEEILRESYAMGADMCYLITDPLFAGADTLVTSKILAKAARLIGFDLILTGRQAIDGDTAQVGVELAEHLGIPSIAYVIDISINEKRVFVKRELDEKIEILSTELPCLITCSKEINIPRYMSLSGIFSCYSKKIVVLDNKVFGFKKEEVGLLGSPTKVKKTFTKIVNKKCEIVETDLNEGIEKIEEILSSIGGM